ncbi:uncharacterized protein LOC119012831 [Acanthopagrus latus]|uniref:uncharacterized protein LOC119012831 n=1 Tax=Acanthopagrus latus TaxID=8177 RepID=UPI00187BD558|nr:uncharacterized protein LOC119012831 [Acanthopagrus latus]
MIDQNPATGSMETTATQDTTQTQEPFGTDTFRPQVESFFQRMTPERWRMLSFGTPDGATKIMLADLLLHIKTSVCKELLAHLRRRAGVTLDSHTLDAYNVTDGLTQTFAETLGVSDPVQSVSSKALSDLVDKEISESVNSALSSSADSREHITPPSRLNAMVEHASRILKAFAAKIKFSSSPVLGGRKKDEKLKSASVSQSSLETVESDGQENISSEDSFVRATSKAAMRIIRKELDDIAEPVLDDVSACETLQSESSQQIMVVADDFAELIVEKTASLEETGFASSSPKPKQQQKLKIVCSKIKTFLAKSLARAGICRIAANLKAQFLQDMDDDSSQSLQSLIDSIDSLIETDQCENDADEQASIPWFEKISSGESQEVTRELSDVLYSHLTNGDTPEVFQEIQTPGAQTWSNREVAISRSVMYADIEMQVRNFLALMSWWLYTQSDSHSQSVTRTLMDQVPKSPKTASRVEDTPKVVQNKLSVRLLVEMVVWDTFVKVHVIPEKKEDIIQRLFKTIWAKVEGADLYIKSLKNLRKAIFKELCLISGSAETLLLAMNMDDPRLDSCIALIFKDHLTTPPKQPCAISRFFSSVGEFISKSFRGRRKIGVLPTDNFQPV